MATSGTWFNSHERMLKQYLYNGCLTFFKQKKVVILFKATDEKYDY